MAARVIFVDANIPMYLIGAPHPNRQRGSLLIRQVEQLGVPLVTDAEVFQEICHRYSAQGRREFIQPGFDALSQLTDHVFPIEFRNVQDAKDLMASHRQVSARDALHVAVMRHHGVEQVMSFDSGFDAIPGIHRLA